MSKQEKSNATKKRTRAKKKTTAKVEQQKDESLCKHPGCTTLACNRQRGFCQRHGTNKPICPVPGCTSKSLNGVKGRKCFTHSPASETDCISWICGGKRVKAKLCRACGKRKKCSHAGCMQPRTEHDDMCRLHTERLALIRFNIEAWAAFKFEGEEIALRSAICAEIRKKGVQKAAKKAAEKAAAKPAATKTKGEGRKEAPTASDVLPGTKGETIFESRGTNAGLEPEEASEEAAAVEDFRSWVDAERGNTDWRKRDGQVGRFRWEIAARDAADAKVEEKATAKKAAKAAKKAAAKGSEKAAAKPAATKSKGAGRKEAPAANDDADKELATVVAKEKDASSSSGKSNARRGDSSGEESKSAPPKRRSPRIEAQEGSKKSTGDDYIDTMVGLRTAPNAGGAPTVSEEEKESDDEADPLDTLKKKRDAIREKERIDRIRTHSKMKANSDSNQEVVDGLTEQCILERAKKEEAESDLIVAHEVVDEAFERISDLEDDLLAQVEEGQDNEAARVAAVAQLEASQRENAQLRQELVRAGTARDRLEQELAADRDASAAARVADQQEIARLRQELVRAGTARDRSEQKLAVANDVLDKVRQSNEDEKKARESKKSAADAVEEYYKS